ncbi:hypothetical protein [Pseudoalteromonas sp. 2CM28B]|uniref:hypothetical protein n=1 Tax=Pseudoalteromonas sp. 2CM28B TaxID=2929851 RepID=UPI0020C0FB20|nr:hypothetical protein [Pseudoalteromonas sp. 2CM28B]MCK8137726.1 hypothetical protein [Pseudoalteromonas sp. 2CM28B]
MRELNVKEIQEVNGGLIINPVTAWVAVRVVQIATPYIQAGVTAAVGAAAAAAGYDNAQE